MDKVLCATMGGEASQRAQDKAIGLALEKGYDLIFLYVVDLGFMDEGETVVVVDIEGEMTKMGEFLLAMAVERAEAKGVKAEALLRKGAAREEIKAAAKELKPKILVLGKPQEGGAFHEEALLAFTQEIEKETRAQVVLA